MKLAFGELHFHSYGVYLIIVRIRLMNLVVWPFLIPDWRHLVELEMVTSARR